MALLFHFHMHVTDVNVVSLPPCERGLTFRRFHPLDPCHHGERRIPGEGKRCRAGQLFHSQKQKFHQPSGGGERGSPPLTALLPRLQSGAFALFFLLFTLHQTTNKNHNSHFTINICKTQIESVFGKAKAWLRRNHDMVMHMEGVEAINRALLSVTPEDCLGYIANSCRGQSDFYLQDY